LSFNHIPLALHILDVLLKGTAMPSRFSAPKLGALMLTSCLTATSSYAESALNYFEVGFGATNFDLMKQLDSNGEASPAASFKALIGGKLTSKNLWFESIYQFNGQFEDRRTDTQGTITEKDITTYSSHSVSFGLKATTNPYHQLAGFLKGGIGFNRLTTQLSSTSSDTSDNSITNSKESDTETASLFYGGAGLSFKISHKTNLNFDVTTTRYSVSGNTFTDTAAFVSYHKFL